MPAPEYHTYVRKVLQAARRVDAEATHAQREAGNARVGKVYCHGLELAIEFPKGSLRKGVGQDGKSWSRPMRAHYGRINRTLSPHDNDPVDFYLGEHPESQLVYVISQLDERGNLDEHKCVLGIRNVNEAKKVYLDHYPAWWKDERLGEVRGYTMEQFKKWLASENPVKNNWNTKESREAGGTSGPSAVIIRGNPRFTANNSRAEQFYAQLENALRAGGYSNVVFDDGNPHTSPPAADLWIGHSRGADRLRFAPPGVKTRAIGANLPGAVNHPHDDVITKHHLPGGNPPDAHYQFMPEMLAGVLPQKMGEAQNDQYATTLRDHADAWHPGEKKFNLVDVQKLIALTKGRQPERVPLDDIWGGFTTSPGFSEDRVTAADTKYPIMVDDYVEGAGKKHGLVDGRHRMVKLRRAGATHADIVRLTPKDIEGSRIADPEKAAANPLTPPGPAGLLSRLAGKFTAPKPSLPAYKPPELNLFKPQPVKTPFVVPKSAPPAPAPVVQSAGFQPPEPVSRGEQAKNFLSSLGRGAKWYGGEMAGVSKADLAAKPLRTIAWSAPKNMLTTPFYAPFTKNKLPALTKWTGRAQTAVTSAPLAAAVVSKPFTMPKQFANEVGSAAHAAGVAPPEVNAMASDIEKNFYRDFYLPLTPLPESLGGDKSRFAEMHRRIGEKLVVPRMQTAVHDADAEGPFGMGPGVARGLDVVRSLSPGGLMSTIAGKRFGRDRREDMAKIVEDEVLAEAERVKEEGLWNTAKDLGSSPLFKAYQGPVQHLATPRSASRSVGWAAVTHKPQGTPYRVWGPLNDLSGKPDATVDDLRDAVGQSTGAKVGPLLGSELFAHRGMVPADAKGPFLWPAIDSLDNQRVARELKQDNVKRNLISLAKRRLESGGGR